MSFLFQSNAPGNRQLDSLRQSCPADQIKLVSKMLAGARQGFTQVMAIRAARCPVVKCIYQKAQMKCDISINNRFDPQGTLQRDGDIVRIWAGMFVAIHME